LRVEGRCHCGKIEFEATVDPDTVGLCHCADCQTLTGSPYRATIAAPAGDFKLRGEPKIYIKTADSGTKRAHAFCPDCGTPIYAAAPRDPPTYSLRIGAIKQRAALSRPRRQIWCVSALSWSGDLTAIAKMERQ
jgi:hypothetical protein